MPQATPNIPFDKKWRPPKATLPGGEFVLLSADETSVAPGAKPIELGAGGQGICYLARARDIPDSRAPARSSDAAKIMLAALDASPQNKLHLWELREK